MNVRGNVAVCQKQISVAIPRAVARRRPERAAMAHRKTGFGRINGRRGVSGRLREARRDRPAEALSLPETEKARAARRFLWPSGTKGSPSRVRAAGASPAFGHRTSPPRAASLPLSKALPA